VESDPDMVTICCTAKILKRAHFQVQNPISASTNALGDWYVNILFFYHRQVLLFVSEKSRLAVITPAKEIRSLATLLINHQAPLLDSIGAHPKWIEAEIIEMLDPNYSTTRSRSLLATMNDYKIQIGAMFEYGDDNLLEIAQRLSVCPVGPLQYQCPRDVAVDLLEERYE
jgi:hypothetical protein